MTEKEQKQAAKNLQSFGKIKDMKKDNLKCFGIHY